MYYKSEADKFFEENKRKADLLSKTQVDFGEGSAMEERTGRGLGVAGNQMKYLFLASGLPAEEARSKAMSPVINFGCEATPDRMAKDFFSRLYLADLKLIFDETDACRDFLEGMPETFDFRFVAWTFEDGSGIVALPGNPLNELAMLLKMSDIGSDEWREKMTGDSFQIGSFPKNKRLEDKMRAFWEEQTQGMFVMPMEASELTGFAEDIKNWQGGVEGWKNGFMMRVGSNSVSPQEFEKTVESLANAPREGMMRESVMRLARIRKERETRLQISWQDALCEAMGTNPKPWTDIGLSAFFMVYGSAFNRKERAIWETVYADISKYFDKLGNPSLAEVPELSAICSSLTNPQVATDLPYFVYRSFRQGGASTFAEKAVAMQRERLAEDIEYESKLAKAKEKGLPALLPKRKANVNMSGEIPVSFARSVEFCAQYGCFLATHCAMWAKETNFESVSMQAKAFVASMIGSEEIAIKCYGYLAKLLDFLSEGKIPKEELERMMVARMEEASQEAMKVKQTGAPKTELKNEWTGKWSQVIASQRIREFLGLPAKSNSVVERSNSEG